LTSHPSDTMMVSHSNRLGSFGMPNLTVKNIPSVLYELLKQSATANRRSRNAEHCRRLVL